MVDATKDVVLCPECRRQMHKSGMAWSGRRKVQRYHCPACGRTTISSDQDKEA